MSRSNAHLSPPYSGVVKNRKLSSISLHNFPHLNVLFDFSSPLYSLLKKHKLHFVVGSAKGTENSKLLAGDSHISFCFKVFHFFI